MVVFGPSGGTIEDSVMVLHEVLVPRSQGSTRRPNYLPTRLFPENEYRFEVRLLLRLINDTLTRVVRKRVTVCPPLRPILESDESQNKRLLQIYNFIECICLKCPFVKDRVFYERRVKRYLTKTSESLRLLFLFLEDYVTPQRANRSTRFESRTPQLKK